MELLDEHSICHARLRGAAEDIGSLRAENSRLRQVNADLIRLLTFLSRAANAKKGLGEHDSGGGGGSAHNYSPMSAMEYQRCHEKESGRLPKSVSVKSSKAHRQPVGGPSWTVGRTGMSTSVQEQHNELSNEEMEFEAYNQGTFKTELCNKWEATGACPYGDCCRFAHGVAELRPVLRNPRYKTEVCREVRAGRRCPYGHRCHFRHSLTRHEIITLLFSRVNSQR